MQPILNVWDQLLAQLRDEEARLSAEVRGYPTPIARCDAQLPGLLEERRRVADALQLALELRPSVEKIVAALEETATI